VTSKEAYTRCYFKEERQKEITYEELYLRCSNSFVTISDAEKFLALIEAYEHLEAERLEEERVEHARRLSQRGQP
jgi:hypothetical protein